MTDAAPSGPGALLRRLGLVCVLVMACARVVTSHDPMPGWGLDPLTSTVPLDGVGPAGEALLAALGFGGLALVLAACARARELVPAAPLLLGAVGLVPVAWHGWLGPTASVENARLGLVWAGAIAGGLGALLACRHERERSLALAACAALVGPLFFRAAIQVYVEHPVVVEDFRARRDEILAANGWLPDSAMARAYERRLTQPDASAWFAMSNVYASLMAVCAPIFAGAALQARRARLWAEGSRHDRYRAAGAWAGLLLSVAGLFIALPAGGAPSKGAVAAMALGLGLFALALVRERLPRPLGRALRGEVLGLGVVALALLAVLVRGMIGPRLGELSLLFRAFYIEAAARIFAERPLWGVGPDGFQLAYLTAKNPLSPEEVASPHSVLFDFASTLGAGGLAWCALVLLLAAMVGRALVRADGGADPEPSQPARPAWLLAVVLPAAALSFATEALPLARAVPDAASLLVLDGLVKLLAWTLLWLGLAAALLRLAGSPIARAGLAAGALALLAHAQIELTAVDVGAAAWAFVLVGAAAPTQARQPAVRGFRAVGATAAALCLALATVAAAIPLWLWQTRLIQASRTIGSATSLVQRHAALAAGAAAEPPQAFLADLAAAAGRPIQPTNEAVAEALHEIRRRAVADAAELLEPLARWPAAPSRAVAHEAVRLRGAESLAAETAGESGEAALGAAYATSLWQTERWPRDSRAWRDLAQVVAALAEAGAAEPASALDPLRRAASLDPFNPDLAFRLAVATRDAGLEAEAAEWARRAVENHERRRLDPLAGLSDRQLRTLRELLGDP